MTHIVAIYWRQIYSSSGSWLDQYGVEVSAECEAFGDAIQVDLTEACKADLAERKFDAEELEGVQEAIEARFQELEEESCRLSKVAQQLGTVAA